MNYIELILALDAAATAVETTHGDKTLFDLSSKIQGYTGPILDAHFKNFGDLLAAQKKAVEKLAANPQVFGAE